MTDGGVPAFTSYRDFVDHVAGMLRTGGMWGAWDDGRFTFGDDVVNADGDTADDDLVRIDPADEFEVGVMAASIASKMMVLATMPSPAPVDGRNRAQRRAEPERPAAGLWTPGGPRRPAPTRRTNG